MRKSTCLTRCCVHSQKVALELKLNPHGELWQPLPGPCLRRNHLCSASLATSSQRDLQSPTASHPVWCCCCSRAHCASHCPPLCGFEGHVNFSDEVTAGLRISDGVVLFIDAAEGVSATFSWGLHPSLWSLCSCLSMKAWDGFSFLGEGFLEDDLGSEGVFHPNRQPSLWLLCPG